MIDARTLAAYLHFGHVPRVDPHLAETPWARLRASSVRRVEDIDRGSILADGARAFRAAALAELEARPAAERHVVPLSAGLDSRLILGTLVGLGLRERIDAVTFGVPGTFDFDLPPRVARAAGVRHHRIDLTAHDLPRASLAEVWRDHPWTFPLEIAWNRLVFQRFGPATTYWSGNLANAVAGEHSLTRLPDWPSACRRFAADKRFTRAIDLAPPGFRPEDVLPATPPLEDSPLNGFQQLVLAVRHPSRIDPAHLRSGHDVRTPFRRAAWVEYMLTLPPALLDNGRFYRKVAAAAEPALFALPVKAAHGLPLGAPAWRRHLSRAWLKARRLKARHFPAWSRSPGPQLNYVDFDRELREPTPLRAFVESSLRRVAEAGVVPWLDPLQLLERHRRFAANLGDALTLLATVALALPAPDER